jgi:hypothetical protein
MAFAAVQSLPAGIHRYERAGVRRAKVRKDRETNRFVSI